MIPKHKLNFIAVLILLLVATCKSDPVADEIVVSDSEEVTLSDSLFGELSEKQQYYQHFIVEIPNSFQQSIDSLASWVVSNEPGGIRFTDWHVDSISRFKMKLDTLPIIQPLYYANYFDYLDIPNYPYWEASSHNRDSTWTRIFENDRIGILNMRDSYDKSEVYDEWVKAWKARTNINFVQASYDDKHVKRDYDNFMLALRNTDDIIELNLAHFDTVQLSGFRKAAQFKGIFLLSTQKESINQQLSGGGDLFLVKMGENTLGSIPYSDWKLNEDNRPIFEASTKRILEAKSELALPEIKSGMEEQKRAVQINLLFGSATLISNQSKSIPINNGLSIYSEDKIKLNGKLKTENNFKIYEQNIENKFDKIVEKDGTKLIILSDSVSTELIDKVNALESSQNTIICFSNLSFYKQLNSTPNLIYSARNGKGELDYTTLVQQCSGQLAFKGDFVSEDSIITGTKTKKIKLARTDPAFCGLSKDTLRQIDYAVHGALGGRAFPGCQVLIAKEGCIIYDKSFGYHTYDKVKAVTSESLYDLASLTKVVSTTMVGMKLYEMDAYGLLDSLADYLPDSLKNHLRYPSTIRHITFQELLTHKSGMPAGFPIIKYMRYTSSEIGRFDQYFCDVADSMYTTEVAENFFLDIIYQDSMWLRLNRIWLDPSKNYKYSDVNMNTLYFLFRSIIQNDARKFGYTLQDGDLKMRNLYVEFLYDKFYKSLGMERTKYKPLEHFSKNEIVPTENERFWRKQLLHGHVHDPNAALYGGIGGNAGIFSTTNDLAILGEMLLRKGTYDGVQYLKPETVTKFTSVQPGSHRGLGWNKPSLNTSAFGCAHSAPQETYGHTGFTGTCIWMDPVNKITYVFLSNRVHPTVNNRIYNFGIRRRAHQSVYDADLF
ncbi:MAG: CubicO group peptidase (beta-lactamase class C family) [Crocinitomix sp.]|jgi:CubicO group peptidase (beta-lactamase class C family)